MGSSFHPKENATPLPWQRNASQDLWERTLQQIPTAFGQLAYLSRLRNLETGRYEHHGLQAAFGEEAAEAAVWASHQEVLESWLNLEIIAQKSDAERYLDSLPQSRKRTVSHWLKHRSYLAYLPASASAAQRTLFEANLRLILESLRYGLDVDPLDRNSSPLP